MGNDVHPSSLRLPQLRRGAQGKLFILYPSSFVIGLVIVFVALGITYGLSTPLFEAHDESSHLTLVRYLSIHRALPPRVMPERPVTTSGADLALSLRFHDPPTYYAPPLYYAFAALITSWTRMDDLPALLIPSPSWEAGYAPRADTDPWNKNVFAHRAQETFAQSETVRAAYLLRLVSLALGAVTILCAYWIARELWPERAALALGAAALVALNPHYIFLSSGATNDTLLNAIFSVFLLAALRLMRNGARWSGWAALGALAGLGALTKQNALMLLPLGLAAIAGQAGRLSYKHKLAAALVFLSVACVVGGGWYARNALLYNDLLGLETHFASQTPLAAFSWRKALMIFESYWAAFGWKLILVEPPVYVLAGLVTQAALLGWFVVIRPRGDFWTSSSMRWRGVALLAFAFVLNAAGLVQWAMATGTSDGRLLYATSAAVSVLLAYGLAQWARRRVVRWMYVALAAFALVFAGSVPWRYLRPAWASPLQPMPSTANAAEAVWGNGLRLTGYESPAGTLTPGGEFRLILYWHSSQAPGQSLHSWVQLGPRDPQKRVAGQDVWLGGTLYPSELWQAGDTVRQAYRIALPPSAPAPGLYWIRLGLADESGDNLSIQDSDTDWVELGPWRMISAATPTPSHKTDFRLGDTIRLAGYDLQADRRAWQLTLYWQAPQAPPADYVVFVHLVDANGRLISQHDGVPVGGAYPTTWWLPGQVIPDRHTLALDDSAGPLTLLVGLYDSASLARLPAFDSTGQRLPDDALRLSP